RESLRRTFGPRVWQSFEGMVGKNRVEYIDAHKVTEFILEKFDSGAFDVCTLIYNEFHSVLTQKPRRQQLIPFALPDKDDVEDIENDTAVSPYDFEPEEEEILGALLPRNIGVQIFR